MTATPTLREVLILPNGYGVRAYRDRRAAQINATLARAATLRAQAAALRALAEEYEAGRVPNFLPIPPAGADEAQRTGIAIIAAVAGTIGEEFHRRLAARLRDRAGELAAAAEESAAAAVGLRAAALAEGGRADDLEPLGSVRAYGVRPDGSTWAEIAR